MNSQPKIPDQETIQRHVTKMREVCLMFDALNMTLDEAIAQAEADIRNSPINVYRREKAKKLLERRSSNQNFL
ncbi:MAG: hypothetical protein AB4426_13330 [Xenococcaceae cyanobacterium]